MQANELLTKLGEGQEKLKKELPEQIEKFHETADSILADGALSKKHKVLIALAIAVAKKCEYCIVKNLQEAIEAGASKEEILEAASVSMLLEGGPGMAYSTFLINKYEELKNN